jgi:hypothetical protein
MMLRMEKLSLVCLPSDEKKGIKIWQPGFCYRFHVIDLPLYHSGTLFNARLLN